MTLLGQNVNSYADHSRGQGASAAPQRDAKDSFEGQYAPGFSSVYKPSRDGAVQFAELLDQVAAVDQEMRIRFTSPHPKARPSLPPLTAAALNRLHQYTRAQGRPSTSPTQLLRQPLMRNRTSRTTSCTP